VDGCDCGPNDPLTHTDAAEVNDGLDNQCFGDLGYGVSDETSGDSGFHEPLDPSVYSWTAQAGATGYDVVRAQMPQFSTNCLTTPTTGLSWTDPAVPNSGNAFFYLNRPVTPNLGSWGQDSNGTERPVGCH